MEVNYVLQIFILVAAYVCAVTITIAAGVTSYLSFRTSRRIESRKSAESRITTLETELSLMRDMVDTFSKRWSKRRRDEIAQEKAAEDDADEPITDRNDLVVAWNAKRKANAR